MTLTYRKFEAEDRRPVYRLFRESIRDYMLQIGILEAGDSHDVDAYMRRQYDLYLHLERSAAEDWVAEDDERGLVGWARSIERDGHLQLTHFFVSTAAQGEGVGRELLQRAFPQGRGTQRSIIATTNPRALALYLRQGVACQGLAFCFDGEPHNRALDSDLEVRQLRPGSDARDELVEIDARLLGFRRDTDIEYFLDHQPAFLFYRQGRPVAYAFGANGNSAGPAGALEAADLPAVLQHIENHASAAGLESLSLTIPAAAATAVNWALANGYRIFPFYEVLLTGGADLQLERYIITESSFLW